MQPPLISPPFLASVITTVRYELNKLTPLPMCGFIAQLVEHRTGIAEVTGSNPVEALIFSRLLLSNCLNWKIYCDDHSSLSSILPQYNMNSFIYKLQIKKAVKKLKSKGLGMCSVVTEARNFHLCITRPIPCFIIYTKCMEVDFRKQIVYYFYADHNFIRLFCRSQMA